MIKFSHTFKGEDQVIKRLIKDIKKAAFEGVDDAAKSSLSDLKSALRSELRTIKTRSQGEIGRKTEPNHDKPELPKYSTDLIKDIFGKDYQNFETMKRISARDVFPTIFGSGFYMTLNGRFEITLPLEAGLSSQDYKNKVLESFKNSIIIDPDTGKSFQLDKEFTDGMKLKCSSKRRNDDERLDDAASRGQDTIVVTAYKQNFQEAIKRALPIDPVIDSIMEGNYERAKSILQKYNHSQYIKESINKVEQLKNNDTSQISPDTVALNNMLKLIKNARIKKIAKGESKIDYVLVSNFQEQGTQFEDMFEQMKSQVSMWLIRTQDELVQAMIKRITEAVQKYGRAR